MHFNLFIGVESFSQENCFSWGSGRLFMIEVLSNTSLKMPMVLQEKVVGCLHGAGDEKVNAHPMGCLLGEVSTLPTV
jgi:hypothetical protein